MIFQSSENMKVLKGGEEYLENLRISFLTVLMNEAVVSKLEPEMKKKFRVYRYRIDRGKVSEEIMRSVVEQYGSQRAVLVPNDKIAMTFTEEEYEVLKEFLPSSFKFDKE